MRNLTASIILAFGLTGSALADTAPAAATDNNNTAKTAQITPATSPATTGTTAPPANQIAPQASATESAQVTPVATDEVAPSVPADETSISSGFATDLSIWGMYQNADIVVKTVMVGLVIASVITWALFFSKGTELLAAGRRLRKEQLALADVKSLDQAAEIAEGFSKLSISRLLLSEVQAERQLSSESADLNSTKERASFRLERSVAAISRHMGRGNGYLATIGAISPFVGLFGTVWGIMNSFIGIAHSQTTNLAVVAPGIAEALLATALGLVAAIPAVVIYNIFARMIAAYRGQVGDMAAQSLLLLGRDLDLANSRTR
ncbi:tonB-system energizer ExbB [Photorhabdus noenieputensis]|uniref:tonB-system energizer ExbB n=1 Tax=Photorhabdus noenieputensis TaxID=1208607 RepID=UPI001BD5A6CB|nr:tonB-system energizer ExbB [Photorhabdus noenieputensis]MBS9437297.1 tonB-system energizer ExbB [Photorhabdus noenieputensis]MCK3668611.1 tonB-system energizer ExbB [Photorhabdus noenieputensis]